LSIPSWAKIFIKSPQKVQTLPQSLYQSESPFVGKAPFFVGHKSLSTTMRYVRIENKEQAEAIDRLEFGTALADTF